MWLRPTQAVISNLISPIFRPVYWCVASILKIASLTQKPFNFSSHFARYSLFYCTCFYHWHISDGGKQVVHPARAHNSMCWCKTTAALISGAHIKIANKQKLWSAHIHTSRQNKTICVKICKRFANWDWKLIWIPFLALEGLTRIYSHELIEFMEQQMIIGTFVD